MAPAVPHPPLQDTVAAALPAEGRIAIAVSGGGDSMALLHLTAALVKNRLAAVTLDHGLRPAAAAEARFAADACAALGVPHETLHWDGPRAGGNVMDQARRARRALIGQWAAEQGIAHVMLAHTADDQAETFLMRLSRAAGIDGLSPMSGRWQEAGVTWHRPLLQRGRAELRDWLTDHAIAWVEDPTNADPQFKRTRVRRLLGALSDEGVSARTLAQVSRQLGAARDALDVQGRALAAQALRVDRGDVLIAPQPFHAAPDEVRRRVLVAALRWIGRRDYPPRAAALAAFEVALAGGQSAVLSGVRLLPGPVPRLTREAQQAAREEAPPNGLWDGRWVLAGPQAQGERVRMLGAAGLAACPDWRSTGLPRESLLSGPAVWQGATLVAAPLARAEPYWTARITADFPLLPQSD